jgi:3'-phosphoadenosine 5'-phosphosulfate sulfotransferase (PAPS reductase)/FAD synthetase
MISKNWRWIVVNSSGGKDSQTALRKVVASADHLGIPRDRIVVAHQFLEEEWEGADTLAAEQARLYGLRFIVSRYRNKDGEELTLRDYVRKRGKWPDSQNRWCTSDFKRGPGNRIITQLYRESAGDILNVFGFRAEESPSRSKREPVSDNKRASSKKRTVIDWLPIHSWKLGEVWNDIKESGVPWHWAYDLGMPRLSCRFCVFAPKPALIIAGRANPGMLEEYIELENETGHTFQHNKPLSDIKKAIEAGEQPAEMDGNWNM